MLTLNANAVDAHRLAQVYAPIIVHDSRETAPLSAVDALLKTGPRLAGDCPSEQALSFFDFYFNDKLLLENKAAPCSNLALDFNRVIPEPVAKSYYHILDSGLYITIQYWLFYAWNETAHLGGGEMMALCGNHEGDWEHVSLRINRQKLSAAKNSSDYRKAIDDIYFSQHQRHLHRQRKYLRENDKRLRFTNAQVHVFSARGTHANYPSPGRWPLFTLAGITLRDENDGKGLTLDLANDHLEPVIHTPWFHYPGHWGATVDNICNPLERMFSLSNDGPFGPGHTGKYLSFYQGDWHDTFRALH